MSDLGRLLPPGFAQAYWDAFGERPPEEVLEAYELLCEVFYHGSRLAPEPGEEGKHGKRYHTGFWFKGDRLFGFKKAVDDRLAAVRAALRTWTAERAREAARGPRPRSHRRDDLARARGPRDPGTAGEEEA